MHAVGDDKDDDDNDKNTQKANYTRQRTTSSVPLVWPDSKDYATTHKMHAVRGDNDDDENMVTLPCGKCSDYVAKLPCVRHIFHTQQFKKDPMTSCMLLTCDNLSVN